MKITCDIIRDLLPLYAEDMVSQDSKKLVDEHLCGCAACKKELEQVRKTQPIPLEANLEPLNHVKKMIVRRRALSVMASVFTLLTLAAFVVTYLFAPFQLTKEEALDDFYVREDGAVVIDYSPYVIGRSQSGLNQNWFINQHSTRYDMWKGDHRKSIQEKFGTDGVITEEERQRYENIDVIYGRWETADGTIKSDAAIPNREDARIVEWESEKNWWYSDPRGLGNDILLHDAGKEMPEKEDRYLFAPIYPMLFFGGIAGIVLLLLTKRFLKKSWTVEFANRFLILLASLVFSTVFVSSGRIFTSDVGVIDQYWGWMIGVNTVFLTLSALFWRQLYILNRLDKGA